MKIERIKKRFAFWPIETNDRGWVWLRFVYTIQVKFSDGWINWCSYVKDIRK